MELNKAILLLLLISSSLLSFLADAICVPRNLSHFGHGDDDLSPAPVSSSSSSSPIQSPEPAASFSGSHIESPSPISSPQAGSHEQMPSLLTNQILQSPSTNPEIRKICGATDHPAECLASIIPYLTGAVDPISVLKMEIQALLKGFEQAIAVAKKLKADASTSAWVKSCLDICLDVYDSGISDLGNAITAISSHDIGRLNTLLSATVSYVDTCEDSFTEKPGVNSPMQEVDDQLDKLASNNLAIAALLKWN